MPRAKTRTFRRRRRRRTAVEPIVTKPNRPAKRKAWTEEQMADTMKYATSGTTSINKGAELYGVPKTTLKDCLNGRVVSGWMRSMRRTCVSILHS